MLHEIDLARADLNLFVVFEAVMAERNVARAAERLRLSPSAVSHGLGRLRLLLNDPVFLKTPKGVAPTERALALAEPIAGILAQARQVMASADPFDPARSRRRFTLAAPDAVAAFIVPPLLARVGREAPHIDLSIIGALPDDALKHLDERRADIAIQPFVETPARFATAGLYVEQFAIAVRKGHPLAKRFSLEKYCAQGHILVSTTGASFGNVDALLSELGMKRRVALSAPNFLLALAIVAATDLVAAIPSRLLALHAGRYEVDVIEPPTPWGRAELRAVLPRAALIDEGVAWLFQLLQEVAAESDASQKKKAKRRRDG